MSEPRPLVIFGHGAIAELAHWYFTREGGREVAAFVVDAPYLDQDSVFGRPLRPFEGVDVQFPPDRHDFFVALSYSGINQLRREKFLRAKALGYRCARFLSPRALILNDGHIGENCLILEHNVIQPFVEIGHNVSLWSGNHIGHHSRIGDHVFIASQVVVSGGVEIGESCFIGVNATLRDHLRVGSHCVIGAGALLLSDAEAGGVYMAGETPRSKVPSNRLRGL